MTERRLTWAMAGDLDPDLVHDLDNFVAFDGETEIGTVKFLPHGIDAGSWLWSLWLTHPGPAFNRPTNGTTPTRREAARDLRECYGPFREWFGID